MKEMNIILLLVATLAFSLDTVAQQQSKSDEHNQHAEHEHEHQHAEHNDAHSTSEQDTAQPEHDHSGHSMNADSNSAIDHEKEHDHHLHGHGHKDHSIDADSHRHTTDHDEHNADSTEHGDMHHHHHMDHDHIMDHEGTMIMGQNLDKLPSGCKSVSEEVEITIRAGRKYAARHPGTVFAFDQPEWRVKPCAKVTFHFVNEDNVRHQFMVHGLPRYIYNQGMFHLEVTGPKTVSGTIIVPGSDDTLLAHCDISHHMEKGMKAQLVIGKGGRDIPSIPGLTPYNISDYYEAEDLPKISDKAEQSKMVREITKAFVKNDLQSYIILLIGALVGLFSIPLFRKIASGRKTDKTDQTAQ